MNSHSVVNACGGWLSAGVVRSDDERFVAGAAQMLKHPQYRVGDSIDVGQERFRDDGDSHDIRFASVGVDEVACRDTAEGALLSVQRRPEYANDNPRSSGSFVTIRTPTQHPEVDVWLSGSTTVQVVSTASVLIAPDHTETRRFTGPHYTLLLTADPDLIESAQRLRYDVFSTEPGFTLDNDTAVDADRFDEHCDHILVREDTSGEVIGCYRMLPPPGAIAAGGLYTATEFDIRALDPLRPSMVEMGRAVVRNDHRNGAVILMMWAGILAYLDRCGYDYVIGCVSVPTHGEGPPGSQLRGIRDLVLGRHRAGYTVHPYRPVVLDGRDLDSIEPPARTTLPPLMRGYLRLGAQICGEPAHDPAFGVGDFPAILDKRQADLRYLNRLRAAAGQETTAQGGQR